MGSGLQRTRDGTLDAQVVEPGDSGGRGLMSHRTLSKPPSCWAGVCSVPQWAPTISARLPFSLSLLG